MTADIPTNPHEGQSVLTAGAPLDQASVACILVHGRGAGARGIIGLAGALDVPDAAFLAPDAAAGTWYPHSFLAPLEDNEPGLSSALAILADLVDTLDERGFPGPRVVLIGFSQGACLALEFAARTARRLGGVVALSGGLIGTGEIPDALPPDDKVFDYDGSLEGTPVFLGVSDVDPHVPLARARRSVEVLRALGGAVTDRIYPGMGHTIIEDELDAARAILEGAKGEG